MKNLLSPLADTGIHKKKFGLEQQLYNFKQRNEQ